ncbi:MAG: RNA polymerase sigma factor [Pirellulales bacterium]
MTSDTPDSTKSRKPLLSDDDQSLLKQCLGNQPKAWDLFLERFSGLFAYIVHKTASQRGIALSSADRDDLISEIMLEIIRNDVSVLRNFAGRASLTTFLTVIARRVCVRSLIRSQKAYKATAAATASQQKNRKNHENSIAQREEILCMLSHLDPKTADIVRMHHLEGRSYGEISRITGIPLGSIGPTLSQAREKMRETSNRDAQ